MITDQEQRRLLQIEAKYSTEKGATEEERLEAQKIAEKISVGIESIKKYTDKDFEHNNSEVWKNINNLSIEELESLISYWDCDDINDSLCDIISGKKSDLVEKKILEAFSSEKDKELLSDVLLVHRDITWNFFRNIF